MSLAEKRLFLLDMDGTIYLSETLFDGTKDFLRYVRESGGRYLFLTNNSSRGTDAYIATRPSPMISSPARMRRSATCRGGICRTPSITSAAPNRSKTSSGSRGCMWRSSFGMRSASCCSATTRS